MTKVKCIKCGKEFDKDDIAGQNKHVFIDHKRQGHPTNVRAFFVKVEE